jgi:hypothetical protein
MHLRASYLKKGMVTIPQINTNLYSVTRIIVFKIQKDLSTSYCTETFLYTDRQQRHNIIWPQNLFAVVSY